MARGRYWRVAVVFLPGVAALIAIPLFTEPYPQPLAYHQFADQRNWLGVPHAGDVLTNLAFCVVGAWGVVLLFRPKEWQSTFTDPCERRAFVVFFIGVFLTGFGSAWYHLEPYNLSLVWDRLPMAVGFMGLFAVMIAERVGIRLGCRLLWPLLVVSVGSVLWWIWTEQQGNGDLRWYLFVQFYTMFAILLMLLLLRTPYTRGNDYWGVILFYAAAKIVELYDHQIFSLLGLISGHNLKHLLSAAAVGWILRMLWLRHPTEPIRQDS